MRRVAAAIAAAVFVLAAGASSSATAPRPRIVVKPIPFGPARLAETRAYAKRHYGVDSWRLVHPHVIVEHYTASSNFSVGPPSPAGNLYAMNVDSANPAGNPTAGQLVALGVRWVDGPCRKI